ncbi:MAG: hypothetical protein JO158_03685 [Gammaproteobacteria bacterium]|nr:hypothetical protein [Gammaproteobacteria bacterium]MBV9724356.1 hypothetical protein [Gammaproteobacteria bacterium]
MRPPSRQALGELRSLQEKVQALAEPRNVALRMFAASRRSTTALAQREFWAEFCWLDQEYRDAVRRLARFCLEHTEGLEAAGEAPLRLRAE